MRSIRALHRHAITRGNRGLLLLLLMAAGFGIIAALLASPAQPAGPTHSANSGSQHDWSVGLGVVGVIAVFGFMMYEAFRRFHEGRLGLPMRMAVPGLIFILVGMIFLIAFHYVQTSVLPGGSTLHTVPVTVGSNRNQAPQRGNLAPNGGGGGPAPGTSVVSCIDLGWLALVVGAMAAAYLLYSTLGRDEKSVHVKIREETERVRNELEDPLRKLTEDPNADPREVMRALYQRLLLALRPRLGALAESTAREVERTIVGAFGVHEVNAHELNRLFEDARYSRHPVGRKDAAVARKALESAISNLDSLSSEWDRPPVAAELQVRRPMMPSGM